MNENPEGTPNPLNPNLAPTGAEPMAAPTVPAAEPTAPVAEPAAEPVAPAEPVPVTVMPVEPAVATEPTAPAMPAEPAAPAAEDPVAAASATSTAAQMEQLLADQPGVQPAQPTAEPAAPAAEAAAAKPEKKPKKTGLIVTLIVFLVVLVGCGVAALFIFDPFGWMHQNRVPEAISRMFQPNAPQNIAADGTLTLTSNEEGATPNLSIDLNFGINAASGAHTATADITMFLADDNEVKFKAEEVRVADGDLYLKIDGLKNALETAMVESDATNCVDGEPGTNCATTDTTENTETTDATDTETVTEEKEPEISEMGDTISAMLGYFGTLISSIDGTWLHISADELKDYAGYLEMNNAAECLLNGNALDVSADVLNSAITATTENLTITQKSDTLYRLIVDKSKFDANSKCVPSTMPTVYVEVNDDYRFTRLYMKGAGETYSYTADFALSYPTNLTVTEPGEYVNLTTLLEQLMTEYFSGEVVEDAGGTE